MNSESNINVITGTNAVDQIIWTVQLGEEKRKKSDLLTWLGCGIFWCPLCQAWERTSQHNIYLELTAPLDWNNDHILMSHSARMI